MGSDPAAALPQVHRLTKADAAAYRKLRLEALRREPEAFSAAWEDEARWPLASFASRLESNVVFGARAGDDCGLVGIVGFRVHRTWKQRHKGVLWGLYVQSRARGRKLGAALIEAAIEHAETVVEEFRITIGANNHTAICLYERAGFERYGVERRALKVAGTYHDEVLMTRFVSGG